MTGSLDQLNIFEKRILYSIVCNKRHDFSQLFLDQLIDCITGNKKPTYVLYTSWIGMILVRDEGESSSNFQTILLSQLSLLVQISQSLGERLTRVKKDVPDIKCIMTLSDDDDMATDDTPPNSPGRVEVDNQKEIVDATKDDQRITDAGEQSETDGYEGFLDLGFLAQAVVHAIPLSVIYPDSYFEGEIPQQTNSYIDFDDDQLNP
ncbi:unnamed protein product [Lactuca saligna]|uniref:Uncharacterized protein n=1 Tax=Lactuca saligna TaxID=75948 RepID=A0AA35YEN3_LACSI|nr:unnamed protein product [Lactuca saligna]